MPLKAPPDSADPMGQSLIGLYTKAQAEKFAGLGLFTTGDLLRHYPRRYLTLAELSDLAELPLDEWVTFVGEVETVTSRPMRNRRGSMLNVVVHDGRSQIHLTFFARAQFHAKQLERGIRAVFTGKVSEYRGQRQLAQPQYDLLDDGKEDDERETTGLMPVYPASGKLTSNALKIAIGMLLDTVREVPDPLPADVRERNGLLDLRGALERVHRPEERDDYNRAMRRFRFEEAFVLQTALARRRAADDQLAATPRVATADGLLAALDERLPFTLTEGQQEVGAEIAADLARSHPMHRLLQGEVGSGKTLVALRAMAAVIDGGGQAALLAPTEVLAAQHHQSMTAMLGDLGARGQLGGDDRGTRITLITGSLSAPAKRKALLAAASGEAGIVVGTHALLSEQVQFADLGLIVVDEQHRFGVEQRDALRGKGKAVPHLLVMTATPIPRTVAMTVFGDLETSTLRQLPAGRSPIACHVVRTGQPAWVERAWTRVREEVDAGHQAFVVCPRIGDAGEDFEEPQSGLRAVPDRPEPNERARPLSAVVDVVDVLRATPALDGLRIEAMHGRMPTDDREDVMARFAAGTVDVLVSTTVIEVGVDVPNATTMVVLDAERFGVSQLHQLRGRVGRGGAPGLCLLVTDVGGGTTLERLQRVAATADGFELAEVDLEYRREGDVLGSAQSGGRSSLQLLRVIRDAPVIATARTEATALVGADPGLAGHPALANALRDRLDEESQVWLERG